jgi:hypothetical protein
MSYSQEKTLSSNQIDEITAYINDYRSLHNAPPMKWNDTISTFSLLWAEYLNNKQIFEHSGSHLYGENLAYFKSDYMENVMVLLKRSIDLWYGEGSLYDYSNPGFSSATGHFTCLVWEGSTEFGLGVSIDPSSNTTIIVFNTFPPGNISGEFKNNVFPIVTIIQPPIIQPPIIQHPIIQPPYYPPSHPTYPTTQPTYPPPSHPTYPPTYPPTFPPYHPTYPTYPPYPIYPHPYQPIYPTYPPYPYPMMSRDGGIETTIQRDVSNNTMPPPPTTITTQPPHITTTTNKTAITNKTKEIENETPEKEVHYKPIIINALYNIINGLKNKQSIPVIISYISSIIQQLDHTPEF